MQFWLIHKLEWDTTLAEKATVEESEEKEEARASFRCEALLFKKKQCKVYKKSPPVCMGQSVMNLK